MLSTAETNTSRKDEVCFYHPGQALYHEESKWWTCCNRGVLDSDVFIDVEGCKRKDKHLFMGSQTPKPSPSATHSLDMPGPSQDEFYYAGEQMEADRDLVQRMQTSEYQQDSDRELATRIQNSRTEYHIKSRSVIGATSSSGKSKAKQASQGDSEISSKPQQQLTEFPSSNSPYNPQSFGSDAPEGYRYQYSDCTGRRKALLIGIDSSEIKNTSAFLRHDCGYDEANTLMLSSQPTKGSILSAMAWLLKGAQMNDCLFFHYSGITRPQFDSIRRHVSTETGSTGKAPNLGEDDNSSHDEVIYPIDFITAGHITNYEMYQVTVQPLRPGVRLTAVFDDFYDNSPLMLPHIYSAQAVLAGADFSAKASQGVARFSSNARRILRAMSSSNSLTKTTGQ